MGIRDAIKQNCKDCIYDSNAPGNYIEQIEACTITACKLHEFRPLTQATKKKREEERLSLLSINEREKEIQKKAKLADKMRENLRRHNKA